MLDEMEALYQARRVAVFPFGSVVTRSEAVSQNWQIFKELLESGAKAAQRVLLGQDGSMTNSGGNYIKSWGLFGVRNDIVESDLSTGGACLATGLIRPWSLINFGRWDRLSYEWMLPDADEDARRASIAERRAAMWADVSAARAAGAVVDQDYVNNLAAEYGISPPRLADATPSGADFYAYELDGGVVTIDEVRARKGLPPLPEGRGALTVPQAQAQAASPNQSATETTTPDEYGVTPPILPAAPPPAVSESPPAASAISAPRKALSAA
jgi:hypothetical protein